MPQRVSVKTIARLAGVSTTTVHRALYGTGRISPQTREQIQRIARELGYHRPNPVARALASGKTQTIALWLPHIFDPFHAWVMGAAYDTVSRDGYELLIQRVSGYSLEHPEALLRWAADGILAFECPLVVDAALPLLSNGRTPVVSLGSMCTRLTDSVQVDLVSGAAEATRHLLERVGPRVAFLTERKAMDDEYRLRGYRRVMLEAGLEPVCIVAPGQSRQIAREATRQYLAEQARPDGIFCFNDEMALGCYRALCEVGLRVPQDVALVGHDGIQDTAYLECALSTVQQPIEQMVQQAWDLLRVRLSDLGRPYQHMVLPTVLSIRESCTPSLPRDREAGL